MGIERLKSTGSGGIMRSESEVKVKVAQLCLTLCDPMDYTVHGILQARILEWVASSLLHNSTQSLNIS